MTKKLFSSATDADRLRTLYDALDAVGVDASIAPSIGLVIADLGEKLHPPGALSLGKVELAGSEYEVDRADRFGRACFYGGAQELPDVSIFAALCDRGDIVWDIGANFGLYAVAAARAGARVFAVEPNRSVRSLLEGNLARNEVSASTLILSCAISAVDDEATFYESVESAFSGLQDTKRSPIAAAIDVKLRKVDTLSATYDLDHLDLMKIDVEGFELEVLQGSRKTLANSPDPLIQLEVSSKNLSAEREAALRDLLHELAGEGMRFWMPNQRIGGLVDLDPADPAFIERAQGNLLMCRRGSRREIRLLETAPSHLLRRPAGLSRAEKALIVAVEAVGNHEKSLRIKAEREARTLRQGLDAARAPAAVPQGLREASENRPRAPFPWRRLLRPYALAEIAQVDVVVRATDHGGDIGATIASARRFFDSVPTRFIVADGRAAVGGRLDVGDALLIQPAYGAIRGHRYDEALRTALASFTGTHIMLVDAGKIFLEGGALNMIVAEWRVKAQYGERVAAFALSLAGEVARPLLAGKFSVFHDGIVATAALAALPRTATRQLMPGAAEIDLSLSLWDTGFTIESAPSACRLEVHGDMAFPRIGEAELAQLTPRWPGVFHAELEGGGEDETR